MKLNLKKQYLLSYFFVVLAVIALTNATLIVISNNTLQRAYEEEQLEHGRLALADMDAQMSSMIEIRNGIKTNYVFQPYYQEKYYTRRLQLIDSFEQYGGYLLEGVRLYLVYCGQDIIFFNRTCADWQTLARLYWNIDQDDPLRSLIFDSSSELAIQADALEGDILYILPCYMGYGDNREKVCLLCQVTKQAMITRLQHLTGLRWGEYAISFAGEELLGEGNNVWQTLQSDSGAFSVSLFGLSQANHDRVNRFQRMLLLLSGCLGIISLLLAGFVGIRQYEPIGHIYRRIGGGDEGLNNELTYINQVISETLRENERVKKEISIQIDSLASQSTLFEQQQTKLHRQMISMLLLGVYRGEQDLPPELRALFSHPKFATMAVWGTDMSAMTIIEDCSDETKRLFAIPMIQQKCLGVLVNLEEDEDLLELVSLLGHKLGQNATIFAGDMVDISGIAVSFIHSVNRTVNPESNDVNDVLLSHECQMLFQAIRLGNREMAVACAKDFSAMLLREPMPMLEIRQIYRALLEKLGNLATELGVAISEENASALMVGMSVETLEEHLAACVAEICTEGGEEDAAAKSAKLLHYIDEHACESDMSLFKVEDVFQMSRKRVTAIVRNMTGMGFREYVIFQRIERAKLLLLSTKLSIGVISEMCGYESPSYFIRSFKSISGRTPGQFQKDMEEEPKSGATPD